MLIGIDGGGTKTKVMLTDMDLRPLAEKMSGPSSIRTVPFEVGIANIIEAVKGCLSEVPGARIDAAFAGMGDIAGEEDGWLVAAALRNHSPFEKARIEVKSDVYNAHAGALEGKAGIIIIIGTGSVAFGVDERGNAHRAGGYSYKEGDSGSAFWLGKQALTLLGKAWDHRIESSPLTKDLIKHFGIKTFLDMVRLYDALHTERTEVAKLAPFVTRHAAEGDPNALEIIDFATGELLEMIQGVDRSLSLRNREIGVIGSLGNADTPLRTAFIRKIKAYDPSFAVFPARQDPVFGSCVLAKQLLER